MHILAKNQAQLTLSARKPGHNAKECPEPRSAEGVECKRCNESMLILLAYPNAMRLPSPVGHFAKDCPNSEPQSRGCRNCGEEGHIAKDCDKPRNPETVTCRNCDESKFGILFVVTERIAN